MNSDVLLVFAMDTLKNAIEIKDMEDVIVKIYLFTDHERKINFTLGTFNNYFNKNHYNLRYNSK